MVMNLMTKRTERQGLVPEALPLGRDSVYWQVMAEPTVFAGGGRALLMQVAHPAVGAGVEQHSSYASDPWGRFFRTMHVMMKLSFGTPEESARQTRLLAKLHHRVVGSTEDGTPYSAMDPVLLRWVWATLVHSGLLMYELVVDPLSNEQRERYFQESKLMAYGCGVPQGSCPATWDDFTAYIDSVVAGELHVTRAARAVAHATMAPPLPVPIGPVAARPHQLVTVGLLAPSLREAYGFEWDDRRQRELDRWIFGVRALSKATPRLLRELPARTTVAQRKPMKFPWLQRHGTELTGRRMAEFEQAAS